MDVTGGACLVGWTQCPDVVDHRAVEIGDLVGSAVTVGGIPRAVVAVQTRGARCQSSVDGESQWRRRSSALSRGSSSTFRRLSDDGARHGNLLIALLFATIDILWIIDYSIFSVGITSMKVIDARLAVVDK